MPLMAQARKGHLGDDHHLSRPFQGKHRRDCQGLERRLSETRKERHQSGQ